jgi:hypothetical protein
LGKRRVITPFVPRLFPAPAPHLAQRRLGHCRDCRLGRLLGLLLLLSLLLGQRWGWRRCGRWGLKRRLVKVGVVGAHEKVKNNANRPPEAQLRGVLAAAPAELRGLLGRTAKKAYFALSRTFHPDKNSDAAAKGKFIEVQMAWNAVLQKKIEAPYKPAAASAEAAGRGAADDEAAAYEASLHDEAALLALEEEPSVPPEAFAAFRELSAAFDRESDLEEAR